LKKILVLGCGLKRVPHAIHLDINQEVNPDVLWDLTMYPWPFEDSRFKSVIAEHILEHLWKQGDVEGYFRLFREIWRICKNGARVICEMPYGMNSLAFCDPGHISFWVPGLFQFLSKKVYKKARETKNMMTQYSIDFDFNINKRILISSKEGEPPTILRAELEVVK